MCWVLEGRAGNGPKERGLGNSSQCHLCSQRHGGWGTVKQLCGAGVKCKVSGAMECKVGKVGRDKVMDVPEYQRLLLSVEALKV